LSVLLPDLYGILYGTSVERVEGSQDVSWIFNFRCGDAWDSRTEFYPTYDYKAVGIGQHDKAQ
jgi:hypothetical protein